MKARTIHGFLAPVLVTSLHLAALPQEPAGDAAPSKPTATKQWPGDAEVARIRRTIEARLGRGKFSKAEFDRAMRPLEQLLKGKGRENPMAWALHGRIWMRVLRQPTVAASDFEKALALDPTHPEACAWSAQLLTAQGKAAAAKERLASAAKAHPRSLVIQAGLLDLLLRERAFPELEKRAEAMLEIAERHPAGKARNEAVMHACARAAQAEVQLRKLSEAAKHYAKAVRAAPKNADLGFAYAEILEKNGDVLAAIEQLRRVQKLIPKGTRFDPARQRVLGKIAMLEPKATAARMKRYRAARAARQERTVQAIRDHVAKGKVDIRAFDDGSGARLTDLALNIARPKNAPKLPVLSKMTARQKAALFEALDKRSAALPEQPSIALLTRLAGNPRDQATRRALLDLVRGAPGKSHFAKAKHVAPRSYWTRIPRPADKEHLSGALQKRRNDALEKFRSVRAELKPRRRKWLRLSASTLYRMPGRWAWMSDPKAVLEKTADVVEVYPLPAAHEARALAHWRLGNTEWAEVEATLAFLSYRFSLAHQYRGGGKRVGLVPWSYGDWLQRGLGKRSTGKWKTPASEQDETARAIFAALAKRDWGDAAKRLLPRARAGFKFGRVTTGLDAAFNMALELDPNQSLVRHALAPAEKLLREGSDAKLVNQAIEVALRLTGGKSAAVFLTRAALAAREHDNAGNLKNLKLALQQEPENTEALRLRGAQLEREKDRRGAMLHYNAALKAQWTKRVPTALKPIALARDRIERAFGKQIRKQYIEGYNALNRSRERETYGVQLAAIHRLEQLGVSKLECVRLRTVVLQRLDRQEDALRSAKRYLGLKDADKALGNEKLGDILWRLGKTQEAEQAYTAAIRAGSQNPNAWHWRGVTLYHQDKLESAMKDFDEALRRGGTQAWTHRYRARIFVKTSRHEDAHKAFSEAARMATATKNNSLAQSIRREQSRARRNAKKTNPAAGR